MRDFFREDAEEVQDTGQRRWVCSQGVDHVCEDVLPLGHLDSQIRKTNTELQPDRLGAGMERRQIPHDGRPELWKLCAGHLVEIVYNLARLDTKLHGRPAPYLALEGRHSKELGGGVCGLRLYNRQCGCPGLFLQRPVSLVYGCCPPRQRTDFWNCSRNWCACSFCARLPPDCIMLCAASTGSKLCTPFAAMVNRVWGRGGRARKRRARGDGDGDDRVGSVWRACTEGVCGRRLHAAGGASVGRGTLDEEDLPV
jgi:hypothetical protein